MSGLLTLTTLRECLRRGGYSPIPVEGKIPRGKQWEQHFETNPNEIALWEKIYSSAVNTGILTKFTPTLDIDIMHPEAAEAIEALARERFEERGNILVRTGKAPKRAILLRTDEPFNKLVRNFTAPNGGEHKIEVLGNGQQVVVAGIHPETKQPYRWHGGEPWETPRENLPYVREADMRSFLEDAARVLVEEYGFVIKGGSKGGGDDGKEGPRDPLDWGVLIANINAGRELHDSICSLAASFIAS
jgi:hypothetical protein